MLDFKISAINNDRSLFASDFSNISNFHPISQIIILKLFKIFNSELTIVKCPAVLQFNNERKSEDEIIIIIVFGENRRGSETGLLQLLTFLIMQLNWETDKI